MALTGEPEDEVRTELNEADGYTYPDHKHPDAAVNAPRRPRALKDTRRWCRGKEGVEHDPQLVHRPPLTGTTAYVCGPRRWLRPTDSWYWGCWHREVCAACGKVVRQRVPCPERPAP